VELDDRAGRAGRCPGFRPHLVRRSVRSGRRVYRYSSSKTLSRARTIRLRLAGWHFHHQPARAFFRGKKLHFGGVLINDVPMFRMTTCPTAAAKHSGLAAKACTLFEEMTEMKFGLLENRNNERPSPR